MDFSWLFDLFSKKEQTVSTSGIIQLTLPTNSECTGPQITKPIKHQLEKLSCPPAIILALLPPRVEEASVEKLGQIDYFEDYGLYEWANPRNDVDIYRFRAVDVDLETFKVMMEPPYASISTSNRKRYLRWWAIPAQHKTYEKADMLPKIRIEPLEITREIPFQIIIEDMPGRTDIYVELTFPISSKGLFINLIEEQPISGIYIARIIIKKDSLELVSKEGKMLKNWTLPNALPPCNFTAKYSYRFRDANGSLNAKCKLKN
jgi:hypothetical protein